VLQDTETKKAGGYAWLSGQEGRGEKKEGGRPDVLGMGGGEEKEKPSSSIDPLYERYEGRKFLS